MYIHVLYTYIYIQFEKAGVIKTKRTHPLFNAHTHACMHACTQESKQHEKAAEELRKELEKESCKPKV